MQGIGLAWPKPSSGSISHFGRDHPSELQDLTFMDQLGHWSSLPSITFIQVRIFMGFDFEQSSFESYPLGAQIQVLKTFYDCDGFVTTGFS